MAIKEKAEVPLEEIIGILYELGCKKDDIYIRLNMRGYGNRTIDQAFYRYFRDKVEKRQMRKRLGLAELPLGAFGRALGQKNKDR